MRRKIADWLKDETVFAVALVLALASCFIVHPDAQYATYIHMNTIVQLLALMIVVCGWQRVGLFHIIGSKLLGRTHTERGLVLTASCSHSSHLHSSRRCSSPTTWRSSPSCRSQSPF